jgi:uncharacterized protein YbjT (DUF2867 family)
MSKLLTVFGASGVQGGSVIRSVLADPILSKSFKIRAVTRDATKPTAQTLEKQGVEVITVSLHSHSSLSWTNCS